MRLALGVVVLAVLAGPIAPAARAGDAWYVEFDEGQAVAKARGKDLLIDFGGSDWCLPCRWLKERVLSRPGFIERASAEFVLIDVDLPRTDRVSIPADRKERYEKLFDRYEITSVPTVVLAMPDGRPYARTTYREAFETPEAYWKYMGPLRERGRRLREALGRADRAGGRDRAEALAAGLAEINARFVPRFYRDRVAELREAGPEDPTGYLAYLEGRRVLDDFQSGLELRTAAIDPAAVDAMIGRARLRGEQLQEALVLRATGEVLAGEDRRALETFAELADVQARRTRFDRGDFVPLDPASLATLRQRIAQGKADTGDGVALEYALHRIFSFDLPNPYEVSCGEAFRPDIRVREPIGDRYGRALIRSTERLEGEARARALAKGLDGTFFAPRGSIREIILERIPALVGKPAARALLPGKFYPQLID